MSTPIIKINSARETKGFFYRVVALGLITTVIIMLGAWNSPKQEKTYKIEVTLEQANALVSCMEQSQAPAVTVNALIKLVAGQINPQLAAEQKKIQDSIDKSKVKPKN
jgi:type II secretory pathway component PulM